MKQNADLNARHLALTILADAVIRTCVAKHTPRECPRTQKEGEIALPLHREEVVMSVPRGEPR